MIYAIVNINNNQFLIKKNQIILVNKLKINKYSEFIINNIEYIVKNDYLSFNKNNYKVKFYVIDHLKSNKINIIKFKRRKNYLKIGNFRQSLTKLKVLDIYI